MDQLLQIAGALIVLAAFALGQMGKLGTDSRVYLAMNAVGGAVLALLAAADQHWGFLILNGTWAIVAAVALVCKQTGRNDRSMRH